jgi:hypothetical protein
MPEKKRIYEAGGLGVYGFDADTYYYSEVCKHGDHIRCAQGLCHGAIKCQCPCRAAGEQPTPPEATK